MKHCLLAAIVISANVLWPAIASCQERWPVSVELGLGRGMGATSGLYKPDDSGITADALISAELVDLRQGRIVAAAGVGVQGAGSFTSECIIKPDPRTCSYPAFHLMSDVQGFGSRGSMTLTRNDLEAIHALLERDAEAVKRADWEAVTRMFTADAVRFPPHQAPVRGRDAMRAWLETFPPIQEFSVTADEIVGCGDAAFVRGT